MKTCLKKLDELRHGKACFSAVKTYVSLHKSVIKKRTNKSRVRKWKELGKSHMPKSVCFISKQICTSSFKHVYINDKSQAFHLSRSFQLLVALKIANEHKQNSRIRWEIGLSAFTAGWWVDVWEGHTLELLQMYIKNVAVFLHALFCCCCCCF